MIAIPNKVLSQHVRESLSGRRVLAATFMTFTLEPEFFEGEIVTLLAGDDLIQDSKMRLLQLEEALRGDIGPITVYYDQKGLREDGGKQLDIRYVPIHLKPGGLFHPKLVLLLTEPREASDEAKPSLVCGVLSSNLTMSGWWSSLECAHFEHVFEGDECSFKDDLVTFLRDVRRWGGREGDHVALDLIAAWLKREVRQSRHDVSDGKLQPRLLAGRKSLVKFLDEMCGSDLTGASLEVISPFMDETRPAALTALIDGFDLRETRVFLPTTEDGTASVSRELYDAVRKLSNCTWARMPTELLRLGKEKQAKARGVHAKVYRFLKRSKRFEAIVAGSHNLSTAAHGAGGNVEASFVVERDGPTNTDWWLTVETKRPDSFHVEVASDEELPEVHIPLQMAYDWSAKTLEVYWAGATKSPLLRIDSAGAALFSIAAIPPEEWTHLGEGEASALEKVLVGTTILRVQLEDGSYDVLLVQETGMSRKPSLVVSWTVAEVLEYWARLSPAQKAAFLQDRDGEMPGLLMGEAERAARLAHADGFFGTFAGMFHGFEMLRKQAIDGIEAGREKHADYLLFGKRQDSLPVLIDRVIAGQSGMDTLHEYLLLLSARQLLRELRSTKHPFFIERESDLADCIKRSKYSDTLRTKLDLGEDGEEFATWFESHFLKNLRRSSVLNA